MKLRLAIYTLYVILLISSIVITGIIKQPKTINTPVLPEIIYVETEKTLDSEIDRLSIKYGVSSSVVRAVIKCESSMYGGAVNKNRDKNGEVWSVDYGPLQVNDYYHEKTMLKLGLDIHNQFDSLEYGIMMMKSQGLQPWSASKKCWSSKI